jgi:hypothetical protein
MYAIPASSIAIPAMPKKVNKSYSEQQPLMKVALDFENGKLKMEGDWQYMMAAHKTNDDAWVNYNEERILVDAAIFPSFVINLSDEESDGLVFAVEGCIKDGAINSYCTGLLIVESIPNRTGFNEQQWNITFHLYDLQIKNCEVIFKLPIYTPTFTNCNN